MSWYPTYDPVEVYRRIRPGMRKIDVARLAGVSPSSGETVLTALERQGLLTSEDERGRIYPFSKEGQR